MLSPINFGDLERVYTVTDFTAFLDVALGFEVLHTYRDICYVKGHGLWGRCTLTADPEIWGPGGLYSNFLPFLNTIRFNTGSVQVDPVLKSIFGQGFVAEVSRLHNI